MSQSDLYLRFVLGEVPIYELHRLAERHIRCNPSVAQFIIDSAFPSVEGLSDFAKQSMDAEFVEREERRITQAWRRLQVLPTLHLPLDKYPLANR